MALDEEWEVSNETDNWDTDVEEPNQTLISHQDDIKKYAQTAHNGSDTAGFWQWLYMDNTDAPTFNGLL